MFSMYILRTGDGNLDRPKHPNKFQLEIWNVIAVKRQIT